jgi:hypothetical protein
MGKSNLTGFKEYCLQFYRELRHPYSPEKKISVDIIDLETALDILDGILSLDCSEKSFSGLPQQFYSAFTSYFTLPRNEIGMLCNSVDKLSALIDPFLKKIALFLLPDIKFKTKSGKLKPLWKTPSYVAVLEALNIIRAREIENKSPTYWQNMPADLAILRASFTARQKGVHESRIHSLEELEKTVHSVVGTYLIVCLRLLKNQSVWEMFKNIIERRKAAYLFAERVRSFPITNTLFSKKEHLFVYRHRADIVPDIEGKKYLFLNYLAGRGPCFYWIEPKDKEIIRAWAKKYFAEATDDIIRTNALRFLINEHAVNVNVKTLLDTLPFYEEKEELAQYIRDIAKPSERSRLLRLYGDKREEVAQACAVLLPRMFSRIDEDLKRLAITQSRTKRTLLRSVVRNLARIEDVDLYRTFVDTQDKPIQIIYIYCLGETGTAADSKLLATWVSSKRRNPIIRTACWYAISRIANRLQDCSAVWAMVNKKDKLIKTAAAEAITREGMGPNYGLLFSKGLVHRLGLGSLVYETATEDDRETVRSHLSHVKLDYEARELVLTLCRVGRSEDLDFLFDLFGECKDVIHFQNHVRVVTCAAKMCTRRKALELKKFINSTEFWSYVSQGERRPRNRLPIENTDNQAFIRRLIAACYIEKATRADTKLILRLLDHNYKWIARRAAAKLSEIGRTEDIDKLVDLLWKLDETKLKDADPAIYALCLLDKRLSIKAA